MTPAIVLASLLLVGSPDFRQLQVRIDGYLGATQSETQAFEEIDVRVGDGPMQQFALMSIQSLMGDGPLGTDILQQVEPIKPNFIFTGAPAQIDQIADAKPNQLLRITGYTQYGSQFVLVQTVEVSAPVTGPTPQPSWREKLLGF
jgi:hypothetical protein